MSDARWCRCWDAWSYLPTLFVLQLPEVLLTCRSPPYSHTAALPRADVGPPQNHSLMLTLPRCCRLRWRS
jgi:hypothetical protein